MRPKSYVKRRKLEATIPSSSKASQNVDRDLDSAPNDRGDSVEQMGGYIFMCNTRTKPDCFIYRVFGLPASRIEVVEKIKPDTKLFLFDFDVKLLYGIYVADSSGLLALEPYAFGGSFPAQVKFSIAEDCLPLPEMVFKQAIKENYLTGSKFKQDLSHEQVSRLVSLFRPIVVLPPPNDSLPLHNSVTIPYQHRVQEVPLLASHTTRSQVSLGRSEFASHSDVSYARYGSEYSHQAYLPDNLGLQQHAARVRYGHMLQIGSSTVVPPFAAARSFYGQNSRLPPSISPLQRQPVAHSSALQSAAHWISVAAETQNHGGETSTVKITSRNEPGVSYAHRLPDGSNSTDGVYRYLDHQNQGYPVQSFEKRGVGTVDTNPHNYTANSTNLSYGQEIQANSGSLSTPPVAASEIVGSLPGHAADMHCTDWTAAAAYYANKEYPSAQVMVSEGSADPRVASISTPAGYGYQNQGYTSYYQAQAVPSDQGVTNMLVSDHVQHPDYNSRIYPKPERVALPQKLPSESGVVADNARSYYHQGYYSSYEMPPVTANQGVDNATVQAPMRHPT